MGHLESWARTQQEGYAHYRLTCVASFLQVIGGLRVVSEQKQGSGISPFPERRPHTTSNKLRQSVSCLPTKTGQLYAR